jgi:signal transduction histidine kinase
MLPDACKLRPNRSRQMLEGEASWPVMATVRFEPITVEAFEPQSPAGDLQKRRVRATLWLTLIFWASLLVTLTLAAALAQNPRVVQIGLMRLAATVVGLFFCYLIHLLLRKPFLSTTRKRLIALAIVAPVFAEIFAWTSFFALAAVDPTVTIKNFTWSGAVNTISFYTWFFLAWAGLYLALSYSFDVQEEQRQIAELREQAHTAQLRALHSQINPHFLFNSLNSVSALILDTKVAEADEMVTKLARFLRLGLGADPTSKIPLSAELELQRIYLSIEQLRYQDLRVSFDVPDELADAMVPALILQPIVENAVKYGVASAPPPASIDVRAWKSVDRLHIRVTDSGKSTSPKVGGAGIGLSNVRQRLRLIYGENRTNLAVGELADGSFQVELSFPLEPV